MFQLWVPFSQSCQNNFSSILLRVALGFTSWLFFHPSSCRKDPCSTRGGSFGTNLPPSSSHKKKHSVLKGPVHTYPDIFENRDFFLCFSLPFTRIQRFRSLKTEVFQNALQSGDFLKQRFIVFVWTGETEVFKYDDVILKIQSFPLKVCIFKTNMASTKAFLVSSLLGLVSSLIAYLQLQVAYVDLQADYTRRRLGIIRLLSLSVSKTAAVKQLRGRPARPRRFWMRPGRTSA